MEILRKIFPDKNKRLSEEESTVCCATATRSSYQLSKPKKIKNKKKNCEWKQWKILINENHKSHLKVHLNW